MKKAAAYFLSVIMLAAMCGCSTMRYSVKADEYVWHGKYVDAARCYTADKTEKGNKVVKKEKILTTGKADKRNYRKMAQWALVLGQVIAFVCSVV